MKTVKLYDENAYLKEFTAKVVSCEQKDGEFYVCLDQTAFFPESGGQTGDNGFIDDAKVQNAIIEDEIIYHICDKPLNIGEICNAQIDFEKRFDKMQNHSGEHIISGIVHKKFGFENTGFHLSDNIVTLDFNGNISAADLKQIEIEANKKIQQNLKISAYYPDSRTLQNLKYRSKLNLTENVRIVEIEDTDICACCAPHVSFTGEIGLVKICTCEKHKNGVRLSIKCGMRAISDYMEKAQSVAEISATLCAKQDEVAAAVSALKKNLADISFSLTKAKRDNLQTSINELPFKKVHCLFFDDISAEDMRFAANQLKEKCKIGGVFCKSGERYNYVCISQNDITDFKNALNTALCGSGGGKNGMIMGSVTKDQTEILKFFEEYIDI